MERQQNTDKWSSLLSELGLEKPSEKGSLPSTTMETVEVAPDVKAEPVAVEEPKESVETPVDDPKRSGEGKRTFFDRFPKINLFGAPAKDPLDAVVSGTKPSVKSGETFTSKKLEKVEPSPGRTSRRETEPVAPPAAVPEEKPVSKGRDPWSLIASQVGHLSVAESVEETSFATTEPVARTQTVSGPPTTREFVREKPKRESDDAPRRGRRSLPSMFDDEPAAESEESTAFRNILAVEEQKPYAEAAERLSSIFDDTPVRTEREREPERRESRQHVRGRRHQEQERDPNTGSPPRDRNVDRRNEERQTEERQTEERQIDERKRGGRSQEERQPADRKRNDRSEDRNAVERNVTERKRGERSFEERTVNEPERGRGRRGSRYAEKDRSESERWERDDRQAPPSEQDRPYTPQPVVDEYEPEAIWDVEDESKPVERSGRRRSRRPGRGDSETDRSPSPRYRETRSEETGSDHADDHVSSSPDDFEQLHRSIPSWDDAISSVVESNIARHAKRGSDQRRGRR